MLKISLYIRKYTGIVQFSDNITSFFEKNKQTLFQYALYRVGNIEDAEDLVSNTYYEILKIQLNKNKIINIKSYVYRSLSNACSNFLKDKKTFSLNSISEDDLSNDTENPDEDFIEEFLKINKILSRLSSVENEIIRFKIYGEMSFREIGEMLSKPENTVRTTYYRALSKIRTRLFNK